MTTVRLHLNRRQDHSYAISIGSGIFQSRLREVLSGMSPTQTAVILDSNISRIYGPGARQALASFQPVFLTFPAGEKRKTAEETVRLFSGLMKNKFDRRSVVVALGGGVTGDLAGFVSSIYLRGIRFLQVPTSLLAMVDSSIGGKTGVDMGSGKNLMGSFHQPSAVIIDPDFLKTLPDREFRNGLAEIIKHAAIRDRGYFSLLRDNMERITGRNGSVLTDVIERSCRIKADVVQKDERETGLRQILNFGHTIGHAVEQASDYSIPHGFAVALGMVAEGRLSVARGILAENEWNSLAELCGRFGLLKFSEVMRRIPLKKILTAASSDKKNTGRDVRCVFLERIGRVRHEKSVFSFPVGTDEWKNALQRNGSIGRAAAF